MVKVEISSLLELDNNYIISWLFISAGHIIVAFRITQNIFLPEQRFVAHERYNHIIAFSSHFRCFYSCCVEGKIIAWNSIHNDEHIYTKLSFLSADPLSFFKNLSRKFISPFLTFIVNLKHYAKTTLLIIYCKQPQTKPNSLEDLLRLIVLSILHIVQDSGR